MSASPEPTVPVEPGSVASGVEATSEVQATDTLPQEGVNEQEAQGNEEDEPPRPRLAFPPRETADGDTASKTLQPTVHAEEDEDSDEDGLADLVAQDEAASASGSGSGSDNEGETYVPATADRAAKIPSFKKKKGKKSKSDDVGTNGEKRGKKSKKSEEVVREDEEVEDEAPLLDEGTLRRLALEERIDNIGKSERKIKRKRKDEEDVTDIHYEEVCNRLRERMERAADKDRVSHENRLPATAKLAMLEDVMAVLRNVRMFQAIVDSRLLEAVSSWLEPMRPSGSLPAEGIQKAIFEVLPRMELDAQTLKETYLGRVVLFYTKAPRVQAPIKRQADTLVQLWSRPILGRPADLRGRKIRNEREIGDLAPAGGEDVEMEEGGEPSQSKGQGRSGTGSQRQMQSQNSQGGSQKPRNRRVDWDERAQVNTTAKGARLEKAQDFQYEIAPDSQSKGKDRERDEHMRRIQMDNMRFNKFARQMRGGKAQR